MIPCANSISSGPMLKHRQDELKERIIKIKTRKPGSSTTLDNTAPIISTVVSKYKLIIHTILFVELSSDLHSP